MSFSEYDPRVGSDFIPLPALAPAAYLLGTTSLRHTIDIEGLPVRLRENFASRPWPTHDLREKIVDRVYVPTLPAEPNEDAWTLEVIDNDELRVGGKYKQVQGDTLYLLNLMLLTRDWSLRPDEFMALGFAGDYKGGNRRTIILASSRTQLSRGMRPFRFLSKSAGYSYKINPAMRLVDRREFS